LQIEVKNLDHLGIAAGIIDQIGLVKEIDRLNESYRAVFVYLRSYITENIQR
jgi:hypothetical protein